MEDTPLGHIKPTRTHPRISLQSALAKFLAKLDTLLRTHPPKVLRFSPLWHSSTMVFKASQPIGRPILYHISLRVCGASWNFDGTENNISAIRQRQECQSSQNRIRGRTSTSYPPPPPCIQPVNPWQQNLPLSSQLKFLGRNFYCVADRRQKKNHSFSNFNCDA